MVSIYLQTDKESSLKNLLFFLEGWGVGGGGGGDGCGGGGKGEHNVQMYQMALLLFKEYNVNVPNYSEIHA